MEKLLGGLKNFLKVMWAESGRGKGGFRAWREIIGGAIAPPAPPVARPLGISAEGGA